MISHKQGFVLLYALMVGVVVFLLALALAPPMKKVVENTMSSNLLNCSTTSNPQTKAICTSIDLQLLFNVILIGIGGLIIWRAV